MQLEQLHQRVIDAGVQQQHLLDQLVETLHLPQGVSGIQAVGARKDNALGWPRLRPLGRHQPKHGPFGVLPEGGFPILPTFSLSVTG
jgi:hypothetical protein